jgi:hypothetical protein
LAALSLHAAAAPKSETVRGKLVVGSGEAPMLETAERARIALDGDAPTRKVLHDPRVNGFEVSARGHFTAPGKFLIDPQHTRALVVLDGDAPTRKVLHDPRVNGFEVSARGHFTAPGKFLIDPQHTRALVVLDGGKPKMITYWCDVCYIRAYAPGPCVCCQKDTDLDLRDMDDIR